MRKAKVGEVRNHLSRYLRYVRRGERVRIFDRQTPVAEIIPIFQDPERIGTIRWLQNLEERGLLKRGTGKVPESFLKELPTVGNSGVLAALLEERNRIR